MTRPRGGQTWHHRATGVTVMVLSRRTVNPMAPVRPHSDLRWSLVAWSSEEDTGGWLFQGGGISHESDFVEDHYFVGQRRKP